MIYPYGYCKRRQTIEVGLDTLFLKQMFNINCLKLRKMKSKQLQCRLMKLQKNTYSLEVIKESQLSKIKGGECASFSCGTFSSCSYKYKPVVIHLPV